MNLYLVTRTDDYDYDEYTDAVVAAESEEAAKRIHPGGADGSTYEWAKSPNDIAVTLIGTTHLPSGAVVLSCYLAG